MFVKFTGSFPLFRPASRICGLPFAALPGTVLHRLRKVVTDSLLAEPRLVLQAGLRLVQKVLLKLESSSHLRPQRRQPYWQNELGTIKIPSFTATGPVGGRLSADRRVVSCGAGRKALGAGDALPRRERVSNQKSADWIACLAPAGCTVLNVHGTQN